MTVKDIMHVSALWVPQDAPIKEVASIIFSTGISGLPVLQDKKLVGIITEEDILSHMQPKSKLIEVSVDEVMNKDVVTVHENTPLEDAEKLMLENEFSRLPVVNREGYLVGMISQGDIFREMIKDDLLVMDKERYAGFISENYDRMINWDQRFDEELPSLLRIFRRENARKILDLGVWAGLFSIGLSQEGLQVTGLENNNFLLGKAQENRIKLSKKDQENIEFKYSDFSDVSRDVKGKVDAVICMGNSLLYLPGDLEDIFKGIHKVLRKDGMVILQILNTDRVLEKKQRLLNFQIQKSHEAHEQEHLFLEFLDRRDGKTLNHNLIVFDCNKGSWIYKGATTVPVKYVQEKDMQKILKEAGFVDISISGYQSPYQGEYSPISFIKPYDSKTSDWMVIAARKI